MTDSSTNKAFIFPSTSTSISTSSSPFFKNDTNDKNINDNEVILQTNHKRGSGSSLFNSDSTLVDNFQIPLRTDSNNSDIQTLISLKIKEEEDNDNKQEQNSNKFFNDNHNNNHNSIDPIENDINSNSFTPSSLSSSNRGLLNRSKFHGLGHRTTKSENFALKLSKKLDKKSINQLNDLQEEILSNDTQDFNLNSNNNNNNDNNNNNNNHTHNNHTHSNSNKFFENLLLAPVDSKNNFSNNSLLTPVVSASSSISSISPKSAEFIFSRNLNPSISSNLSFSNFKKSSSDSLPIRPNLKFKNNKLKLPPEVNLLNIIDAEKFINEKGNSYGPDYLSNLMIIDTRPFHDYCKSHIDGAFNICLPSTLLKRSTFDLDKCIQTLTNKEKKIFSKYFTRDSNDMPAVLFYDNYSSSENDISSSIYYLAGKFLQNSSWKSLYILQGGFIKFNEIYPSLIDTGSNINPQKIMINLDSDISSTSINSETFSPSSNSNLLISPQSLISPDNNLNNQSNNHINFNNNNNKNIGLSRFVLPDCSHIPIFKTRNYDEFLTNKTDGSIHLTTQLTPNEISSLPTWLGNSIGKDLGSSKLSEKFNELQINERTRLNHALTKTDTANKDLESDSPLIPAGVELGGKNRYKDIFPYEHSRVKIEKYDSNSQDLDHASSYINASYIHYPTSSLNYIATQGPLNETIGDFWRVVYDNKVPIIFSLTPETENKVEKCAPFWNSGIYLSDGIQIKVEVIEEINNLQLSYKTTTLCAGRRISIKVGVKPIREVLQIHMMSWPDFGIVICEEDILSLVSLKRYITKTLDIEQIPILVHCSAGCGRTGSFCVIDTCIDKLFANENGNKDENKNKDKTDDLIYDITSVFRSQRVLMVQTLRQYILIYDTVIKFIKMHEHAVKFTMGDDVLTKEGLIDWEKKDPGIIKRFLENYK